MQKKKYIIDPPFEFYEGEKRKKILKKYPLLFATEKIPAFTKLEKGRKENRQLKKGKKSPLRTVCSL